MSRRILIAANWKMNGSFAVNTSLLQAINGIQIPLIIAPPSLYIASVRQQLVGTTLKVAAQNVAAEAQQGAYTGEVSAKMLADAGVSYAIIGHSERRQYYGETDALVAQKCQRLHEFGLTPIICVGESLAEREAGLVQTVVERQLTAIIDQCGIYALAQAVVAYEPVWAIGTGKTATPADAQAVHQFLRELVAKYDKNIAENLYILYGGSVKADNAASLFAMPDIDGALVGGASLVAKDFLAICHAAKTSVVG
ncbi:triose-phosphate isomerase [Agitococcus lubricus]|uniref:Triosephosphate isomerase n=1 Tax=Agitococcus lubricus TaxID=1077255 RepID=A0A2T5J305_9GAMM|nr:triose-phosphate isomerase [Agitococcus lubricus]PTQ91004.1 triosephosphate isomerase [Agitococcus lubricus]